MKKKKKKENLEIIYFTHQRLEIYWYTQEAKFSNYC